VGKELFAERIHQSGPRGQGPLIRFNAAALSPSLQEAQLFGHEEGAYTGAVGQRKGLFGEADRGTLFIDEVGEMPLGTQAKLLRALETGRITRVGGSVEMPVDVRVVCATHRDLEGMVARGEFREDLYFRIAQLQLRIPPLRERRRDIEPLAQAFLSEAAKYTGTRAFTKGALRALHRHPWHGNVRELRNVVREVAASSDALHIGQEAIEARLSRTYEAKKRASHPHSNLTILLQRHHGNVAAAARELGVPRSTLRDRLRRQRCG
jgi:two-component system NtrC family response regulator